MSEPTHYQVMRSRNNTHLFVICYADRFYDDVPLAVRNRGPWAGDRGLVQNLRPEIRLTLRARATWWSRRRRLCSTRRRRAASKKDADSGGRWNRRPQRAIRGYKQRAAPVLLRPTAIQRRFRELSSSGCRSAGRKWPRRTGARGGQYSCASSLLQGLPPNETADHDVRSPRLRDVAVGIDRGRVQAGAQLRGRADAHRAVGVRA